MTPLPRRRVAVLLPLIAGLALLATAPSALSASTAPAPPASAAPSAGSVEQQFRRVERPTRLRASAIRRASVTIGWAESPGRGIRYRILRNGRRVATTARTQITVAASCGRPHRLAVQAIRLSGGRSLVTSIRVRTLNCRRPRPVASPTPPATAPAQAPDAPATLFVSPNGSDSGPCRAASPCASFDRALDRASAGEVVEVAGGEYRGQRLGQGPAGVPVTFRPAAGATVRTGEITVDGGNVVLRGMTVDGWTNRESANDVTFVNMNVTGGVYISSSRNIRMFGGAVGPGENSNSEIKAASDSSTPPTGILFDGVRFHDWLRTDDDAHVECLHVMAADGLTIRNSRFETCEHFDILFTVYGDAGSPRNIVIENNHFQCCESGYYSIRFSGNHGERWQNILLQGNTMTKAISIEGDIVGGVRVLSNTMPDLDRSVCRRVEANFNLLEEGPRCGPQDRIAG